MPPYDDRYATTRLYVGHTAPSTKAPDLFRLFGKYGSLRSVDVQPHYAFVEFHNAKDAHDARYHLDGKFVDGRRIVVEFAQGSKPADIRGQKPLQFDGSRGPKVGPINLSPRPLGQREEPASVHTRSFAQRPPRWEDVVEDDETEYDESEYDESEDQAFPPALYADPRAQRPSSSFAASSELDRRVAERGARGFSGPVHDVEEGFAAAPSRRKMEGDRAWVLTAGSPGGPMFPTVIPSFKGHIAFRLWNEPELDRGMIQCYTRERALDALRRSAFVCQDSERLVRATGLFHLRDCMLRNLDLPLLVAFVERWQPDTNTFHMPFGEMTILLHDVFHILRIPVDGELLSGGDGDSESLMYDMCELLTLPPDKLAQPAVPTSGKMFPWYKDGALLADPVLEFVRKRCDKDAEVQCYLLLLLGSTLFVDNSGDRVSAEVNLFLKDYNQVSKYAWGAGTLAYMYRQLGVASRADAKGLCGCLTLLQVWIYEYFPTLRPTRCEPPVIEGQPRALRWLGVRGGGEPKAAAERLRHYRRVLDTLTEKQVKWLPYGRNPGQVVPRSLYHGVIRFGHVAESYDPARCLRQFGYKQVVPSPPLAPTDVNRPASGIGYEVMFPSMMDQFWGRLGSHMLSLDIISVPAPSLFDVAEN